MSTNKNALIRYQVLDRCFRNTGRMYFWEDLLTECNKALSDFDNTCDGIQRRQLFDDIRFMESEQGWSIPLGRIRHGRRIYYRYDDSSFSITKQPLNPVETEQIKSAIQILSRFSGTPQFEWIHELIPMLESKFGLVRRNREVISFESNVDLRGINFLSPLFNAIINERVLLVKYRDFKTKEPYDITFHPYYLKQYNSRWFVFGLNSNYRINIWNLALDRIESMLETSLNYESTEIDWDDYFYDLVGVTRPKAVSVQKVILNFSDKLAPYIISKPIHPSQKHKIHNSGISVIINVVPNVELENLILSFGEQVQVISPIGLRESISNRLKVAVQHYRTS